MFTLNRAMRATHALCLRGGTYKFLVGDVICFMRLAAPGLCKKLSYCGSNDRDGKFEVGVNEMAFNLDISLKVK